MIYLYDRAIVEDMQRTLTTDSVVKVISPEDAIDVAAQIQNDKIKFPIIVFNRTSDSGAVDESRTNFTAMHRGIATVIDETNDIYCEKILPIKLGYDVTVITTNTVDMDEIMRELRFKYLEQFFLNITLPYEAKRQIRFGVMQTIGSDIETSSAVADYIQGGKLYQSIMHLTCLGAILVSYTPVKLTRVSLQKDIHIIPPSGKAGTNT